MSSYKYLLKNVGLFTISEFASKFITFFMLPLYTYYLSTEEYAVIDLIQVTQNLIIPVVTLSVADAVLRFAFDRNENTGEVFSLGVWITAVASVLVVIGCLVGSGSEIVGQYLWWIVWSMITMMFSNLLSNFARAIDKVQAITVSSIITTAIVAGSNVLLVAYLKMGVAGYLCALVLGNAFKCLYLAVACRTWGYIHFCSLRKDTLVRMLKYSLPLIPNSMFWWVNSSINKYFLTGLTTLAQVGLYSAASKIPAMGNIIANVFNSAWRMSAIKEVDSEDKNSFFEMIYELYTFTLAVIVLGITVFVKLLALILFSKDFYDAWIVVPFLMLGFYFDSINAFIGNLFVGAKITKVLFTTTVVGAVANVALNAALIPSFGIIGAAIATTFSNMVIFFVRRKRAKEWLQFSPSLKKQGPVVAVMVILALAAFSNTIWLYILFPFAMAVVLFIYRQQVGFLYQQGMKILGKVKK